ncbi:acetyl-CoA hydrolase/transferase C-terminal domain-containing protein [Stakelama tenebrarum]|uniref:Acetyl-CoA hydrolase n=1 Tax=Stakelama tenebrarum TaxID=2711215 RepID=A0A6G6Y5V6_9SPHN|nr:acetyl-CoA hydrolase/transferase C-terminal domain-containing protein [Sphingosinithalassobacter tenebrarum]QIG80177.1 acetyl-CoA hydrolase [Sphingosinithalassobacter tenebrarum]
MTRRFADADALAEWIVATLGAEIRTGLPLGIGKATHVANALFARAKADPALRLEILTALTLERPHASSALEKAMMDPFVARHFAGYVELDYARALRGGGLPPNVHVSEFFLNSGAWLSNPTVQQSYNSVNYTAVAADVILARPINLLAQLIAIDESGPQPRYSLSGNPDVTLDVLPELKARRDAGEPFLFVGQVNRDLPFMPGSAELPAEAFDAILDDPSVEFSVFAVPRRPVTTADYVAGLHAASLVKDGGTLQIGIGSLGDAVTYALILRHKHNALFRELLGRITSEPRETEPFEQGLYAASEMFVDGFLDLYDAGILKRRSASGHVLHAAFFAGSRDFYDRLKAMPEARRADFDMTAVSFTNALYGDEETKRRDRPHARFLNNTMKADVFGAVQSDVLDDGRVVSGVGGQHDFVEQALALRDANSILMLHSHRIKDGEPESNIVWQLDRTTIPRHMRDIVITEYGVARLKGASDSECIRRMAAIADARFVNGLLQQAGEQKKVRSTALSVAQGNQRERLERLLAGPRADGFFPAFPFGSDFTAPEQTALRALTYLKQCGDSKLALARTVAAGLTASPDADEQAALDRLDIGNSAADILYRRLLLGAWRETSNKSEG